MPGANTPRTPFPAIILFRFQQGVGMRLLNGIVLGLGFSLVSSPAWAQADPAAKAKLQAMADAVLAMKSIEFDVVSKGEGGMLGAFTPVTTGKVMLQKGDKPGSWKQRRSGKAEMYGSPTSTYLIVSDGAIVRWVDERNKTFNERPEGQASGDIYDLSRAAFVSDFVSSQPWSKELAAPVITSLPAEKLDGVDCDVVQTDLGAGPGLGKTKFAIAQSDHLPRKITSYVQNLGDKDAVVLILTNVNVNTPAPEGSFAISKPEGYTVIGPVTPGAPPKPSPTSTDAASTPHPAPNAPGAPAERAIGGNVGDLAPDFELASTAGDKVKLSAQRGHVVLLDFWGTWCIPCGKAAPDVQKLSEAYKDKGVKVLALAVREKDDAAPTKYMKEHNYTYTALLKGDDTAKAFRVKAYPTYFVIGPDGVISGTMSYEDGFYDKLSGLVDKALGASKPAAKDDKKAPAEGDAVKSDPMSDGK
jgi:thiol-disulfide isomerase/thioredoxin/outer membrane lipoprotein-sorting protein